MRYISLNHNSQPVDFKTAVMNGLAPDKGLYFPEDVISLSKKITDNLLIPSIGIGSSANCDGQVLVIDDLIGLSKSKFKFVKKYINISRIIENAVKRYKSEVTKKRFPTRKHSFNT